MVRRWIALDGCLLQEAEEELEAVVGAMVQPVRAILPVLVFLQRQLEAQAGRAPEKQTQVASGPEVRSRGATAPERGSLTW